MQLKEKIIGLLRFYPYSIGFFVAKWSMFSGYSFHITNPDRSPLTIIHTGKSNQKKSEMLNLILYDGQYNKKPIHLYF